MHTLRRKKFEMKLSNGRRLEDYSIIIKIKPNDSWVTVHSLKTSDGGLLDPDDRLNDVADDREQIVAVFEERDGRSGPYGNGDGRSASPPDGTRSPVQNGDHKFQSFSRVDIEVTGEQEHTCSLQVRRGSEPALNQLCPLPQFPAPASRADASKRWSAAPIIDDEQQVGAAKRKAASCDLLTPPEERGEPSGDERDRLPLPRLARDMNRLSMQILGNSDQMWRWADAADRVLIAREQRGRPPTGSPGSPDVSMEEDDRPETEPADTQLVVLSDVRGPLGLDVVPEGDLSPSRDGGVLVQRVEPDGVAGRDGRLRVGDRITQVNGHSLAGCNLHRAQELMTMAMSQGEVRLTVSRSRTQRPPPPAPVYPSSTVSSRSQTPVDGISPDEKAVSRVATVTPTKKVPVSLSSRTQNVIMTSNTRKLGRRMTVSLMKGTAGLGFSVTTRDNPAGGHAPVYVKNILPKGAAIEDGRLRPGDRLLEIDGSEVTGLSQQQVVQVLRAVSPGQTVQLIISRHEQPDEKRTEEETAQSQQKSEPSSPQEQQIKRAQTPEQPPPPVPSVGQDKEILVFDIAFDGSERSALGLSVKGRTTPSESGSVDTGIYIKSVLREGAASRDGRLQRDDQLIDVNNNSLLGLSNAQAMEALRRAMSQEGSKPGILTLTVARRRAPSPGSGGQDPVTGRSAVSTAGQLQLPGDGAAPWRTEQLDLTSAGPSEVTITHRRAPPSVEPPPAGRNPVVDRLTGRNNIVGEAAYGASRPEPWSDGPGASVPPAPPQQQRLAPAGGGLPPSATFSPTVNMPSGDTVVIETDPPSASLASLSSQQSDADTDAAYASQTSLEQAGVGFTRDQLGRQSISEKRHASKDAKSTDTYQRTKRAREEREAQRRQIEAELRLQEAEQRARPTGDVGPSLGMKKSSSLESLQTMVHELALSEERDRPYPRPGNAKVVRGRGCNESFRAAVDRSYEAPLGDEAAAQRTAMDTVDEEAAAADADDALFIRDRTVRQSSLSTGAVDGKKGKRRSGGLLKGLGSMFRFGKHRKAADGGAPAAPAPRLTAEQLRQQQEELNRIAARYRPDGAAASAGLGGESRHGAAPAQRERQERQERQEQGQQSQRHGQPPPQQHRQSPPAVVGPPPPARSASRSERVQELREQHQRRHRERQPPAGHRADTPEHQLSEAGELKPQVPPLPSHLVSDRLNNNVHREPSPGPAGPGGFWRAGPLAARGGRSSEYFRNQRPAPLSAERAALWQRSEESAGWIDQPPDPSRRPATRTGMAEPRHTQYPLHDEGSLYSARAGRPKRWSDQVLLERLENQFQYEAARSGGAPCPGAIDGAAPQTGTYTAYIRRDTRRQHQVYHSQRSGRPLGPDPKAGDWTAAGYFEYESVQAMMRLGGGGGGGGVSEHYSNRSLPRRHERMRAGPHPGYPAPGLKHAVSAGPSGPRRPPHPSSLGIPTLPPGVLPQYGRAVPDVLRRGPPHRPPALSPPGSRV
ncbi:partitioning defective 3 homolog B-like isoform X4 [Amphibalanus amphitrite]|uniref:partitioning defective 3 homolog B-like isoform X4 n=1 Tax=Amphibalanus amphitrite TaxID=1232801 RepID=UPI001C90F008|nr:partitioning defective 3 homolog B-like isoform X4 [Amphibalanus amphitrite]